VTRPRALDAGPTGAAATSELDRMCVRVRRPEDERFVVYWDQNDLGIPPTPEPGWSWLWRNPRPSVFLRIEFVADAATPAEVERTLTAVAAAAREAFAGDDATPR
jgi:hypothetical protein